MRIVHLLTGPYKARPPAWTAMARGALALFLWAPTFAGEFTLSPIGEFTPPLGGADSIELADVDGDGTLDVIVVSKAASRFACYRGRGDGSFGEEISSGSLYLEPNDLAVGDFDADGHLDLAATNSACG